MMRSLLLTIPVQLFLFLFSYAQQRPPAPNDSLKVVDILHANRYGYQKNDSLQEFLLLVGKVALKQDNTLFYADSAVYKRNARQIEAFGNIHINDDDTIHTYAQYLLYYVDTKIAILKNKVRLTDGKSNLYTEELEYDVNQKIGTYKNGGRVVNATSVLTSKEGTYYADLKDVYFKQDVKLNDPKYTLASDSLLYNTNTEIATFISQTLIRDSAGRTINTREGYYDLKNRNAFFTRRPIIKDGAVTVIADEVETDDRTGGNRLIGNALFRDTVQGVAVLANYIYTERETGYFMATQRPLMILKQDADSIYIAADTLFSGRLSLLGTDSARKDTIRGKTLVTKVNDSTDRYFQAYHHVRIFSDSLQAVSDSLFYSGKDSIFKLFRDPIVWANMNQVTGDTIYLYTKNKQAKELYVFENGLVVNKAGENMFNQIRGNRLNGYFKEGVIDHMRARGNAESIYYAKDDQDYLVGVNKATADIIDMRFKERELNRVVFISDVKGTMFPVSQFPEGERTLRNFKWQEDRRPKTKFELFGE
jgi:lipopolysaccharide export system protein LptA